MYNRLSHHMHTNMTVPEQCGIRQGSSIENAVFKLTDSVPKSIDQKMLVSGEYSVI
jgi:hypothetical protein